MTELACLVAGYIIGAYLMRRHMLKLIHEMALREVEAAMAEYERGLLRRLPGSSAIAPSHHE